MTARSDRVDARARHAKFQGSVDRGWPVVIEHSAHVRSDLTHPTDEAFAVGNRDDAQTPQKSVIVRPGRANHGGAGAKRKLHSEHTNASRGGTHEHGVFAREVE